jgi:hypothetical protein
MVLSGSRHSPQRSILLRRCIMSTYNMTPQDRQRLDRGAAHLHKLGPRATSEMLATLAARIGGGPALLAVLAEFERLPPGRVRTATGDHSSSPRVLERTPTHREPADENVGQARRVSRKRTQLE